MSKSQKSKFSGFLKEGRPTEEGARGPGRAKGKRSNPDYVQITAYLKKDTYRAVKVALLDDDRQDFSELVETLLAVWLAKKPRS